MAGNQVRGVCAGIWRGAVTARFEYHENGVGSNNWATGYMAQFRRRPKSLGEDGRRIRKDLNKARGHRRINTEDEMMVILSSEKRCLCMICKAPGVLRYQRQFESRDYLKLQVTMDVVNNTPTALFGIYDKA